MRKAKRTDKQAFAGKQTSKFGLWYDKHRLNFKSNVISLDSLQEYDGKVRLVVCKNQFFNKGENNRPNYICFFCDANASTAATDQLEIEDCEETEETAQLFTYDQVQYAINRAVEDALNGYTDNIVSDYL